METDRALMLTTLDRIRIRADLDVIFAAAAAVERWPDFLAHYRWVQVWKQQSGERVVEMAARRGQIPVRWTACQLLYPTQRCVYYRHLSGPTRGMEVTWTLQPGDDGVEVTIIHRFSLEIAPLAVPPGSWIVGFGFVSPIAQATLAGFKRHLEATCGVQ
jgi:ribosome-associated toxin RatA of RatAB toxin-antitoxin module